MQVIRRVFRFSIRNSIRWVQSGHKLNSSDVIKSRLLNHLHKNTKDEHDWLALVKTEPTERHYLKSTGRAAGQFFCHRMAQRLEISQLF
jgi:hypothetical protein